MSTVRTDVGRWAMAPEWLMDDLLALPSDAGTTPQNALFVFTTLAARFAHRKTEEATSLRAALASACGLSEQVTTRALTMLRKVGALTTTHRGRSGGDVHTLHFADPRNRAVSGAVSDEDAPETAPSVARLEVVSGAVSRNAPLLQPEEPERGLTPSRGNGTRRSDPLWDAVMDACGVDTATITHDARGAYNRAVGQLRSAEATPEEVSWRASVFRSQWPGVSLTPTALARRWAECARRQAHAPPDEPRFTAAQRQTAATLAAKKGER